MSTEINPSCLTCKVPHKVIEIDFEETGMYCQHLKSIMLNYKKVKCDFHDPEGSGVSQVYTTKVKR